MSKDYSMIESKPDDMTYVGTISCCAQIIREYLEDFHAQHKRYPKAVGDSDDYGGAFELRARVTETAIVLEEALEYFMKAHPKFSCDLYAAFGGCWDYEVVPFLLNKLWEQSVSGPTDITPCAEEVIVYMKEMFDSNFETEKEIEHCKKVLKLAGVVVTAYSYSPKTKTFFLIQGTSRIPVDIAKLEAELKEKENAED